MIHTAPCMMLWCRHHPLLGQVGWGWALEISSFLGPVKWHQADGRVPFGAQKTRNFRAQPSPTCPSNGCFPHQKHYARGRINHSCIGGFMYKCPPWRGLRVHTSIICVHTSTPFTRFSQRQTNQGGEEPMREVSGSILWRVGEQVHKGT
jgi:hypothetical protein